MSIIDALNIAWTGIIAQQKGMDVTSHNIANADTPGYCCQIPIFETIAPIGGVKVPHIIRAYDMFTTSMIHQKLSVVFDLEVGKKYLENIEGLFNETEDSGLRATLSDFFNSWEEIANNPSSLAERIAVIENGQELANKLNTMYQDLENLRLNANSEIKATVEEINNITSQIAQLNAKIAEFEAGGENANDLRDKRNLLVEELSKLVGNHHIENKDGKISIFISKGSTLVQGKDYNSLEVKTDSGGNFRIILKVGSSEIDITDDINSGKIAGLLNMRDEVIPEYKNKLNALATSIIKEVNKQHSQGVGITLFHETTGSYEVTDPNAQLASQASGLDFWDEIIEGNQFTIWVYDSSGTAVQNQITIQPGWSLNDLRNYINTNVNNLTANIVDGKLQLIADDGYSFGFSDDSSNILMALGINTFFTGKDAEDIGINSLVSDNPEYIAAAKIENDGSFAPGDGRNAQEIANLQDNSIDELGDTLNGYLSSLVGEIGIKARGTYRNHDFHNSLLSSLKERRESIQGVSLDEEMANLIKFQRAYEACIKIMQVSDEMFEDLLQIK